MGQYLFSVFKPDLCPAPLRSSQIRSCFNRIWILVISHTVLWKCQPALSQQPNPSPNTQSSSTWATAAGIWEQFCAAPICRLQYKLMRQNDTNLLLLDLKQRKTGPPDVCCHVVFHLSLPARSTLNQITEPHS